MLLQPSLAVGVVGDDALYALPEGVAVAALNEVHQFVGHQVFDHPMRQHRHPPMEVQVPIPSARAPAVAQVLDAHLAGFGADPIDERGDVPIQHRAQVKGVPADEMLPALGGGVPP
jgi:hypothetical protein